jgi:hypothetical protein
VLQFIDLFYRLVFLGTLVHFLLTHSASLTRKTWEHLRLREAVLIAYPFTIHTYPWSIHSLPFVLVVVTILSNWPNGPRPGDSWFSILHLALAMHLLQLHAPHAPSPVFLLPVESSLPLSSLVVYGVKRIFLPGLLYFLPITLFTAVVLSLSLADTFQLGLLPLGSAPIESRRPFLALFAIAILVLISSPLIVLGTPQPSSSNLSPWDRYSTPIGIDARRAFVRAVVLYGSMCMFPPPFNIIQLVFVRFPLTVLRHSGNQGVAKYILIAERVMWRVIVVPQAAVVGGVWLWGWSGRRST